MAVLVSVQVGRSRMLTSPAFAKRPRWRSAFFKSPVLGPVRVLREGLEGDQQGDRRVHGGPEQALLAYSADHYPYWRAELGGEEMSGGGFGENLTVAGQDEGSVCIGDVFAVGSAVVQVSHPRGPCYKIGYRWARPDLLKLVEASGRHGWYLRVLQEGIVEAGVPVELVERPYPGWTVRGVARTGSASAPVG